MLRLSKPRYDLHQALEFRIMATPMAFIDLPSTMPRGFY
jgi:hypothetical protein